MASNSLRMAGCLPLAMTGERRRCFFRRLEGSGAGRAWIETEPAIAAPESFGHG